MNGVLFIRHPDFKWLIRTIEFTRDPVDGQELIPARGLDRACISILNDLDFVYDEQTNSFFDLFWKMQRTH